MIVMIIAITPSVNASSRPLGIFHLLVFLYSCRCSYIMYRASQRFASSSPKVIFPSGICPYGVCWSGRGLCLRAEKNSKPRVHEMPDATLPGTARQGCARCSAGERAAREAPQRPMHIILVLVQDALLGAFRWWYSFLFWLIIL
jgi:hypothetical protein